MAGADAGEGPADPLDQPPDSAGLLAVADPARVRPDQHRRLRGPALPPVGGDLELRRVDGLAKAKRAAAARRDLRTARGRDGIPARPGLLVRLHWLLLAR